MARITVTTNDGEIIETFSEEGQPVHIPGFPELAYEGGLAELDLTMDGTEFNKPEHVKFLGEEIAKAIRIARKKD